MDRIVTLALVALLLYIVVPPSWYFDLELSFGLLMLAAIAAVPLAIGLWGIEKLVRAIRGR